MSLIVKISADTAAFKRAINTVSKDVQGFGKSISKMGDSFKPATVAATGLFAAAIKSGSEFEAKMSEVSAIGQIYGNELEQLTEKAKQIGLQTKFSASEAADGLRFMGQAGWNAKQSMEGIDAVMTLAAAGAVEVGRASDIVTDAITALGYSAKDSAKFVDVMAVVASKSNTSVDMLGDSFKFASQIAGTLGVNIEDLSLALGLMANASVKGNSAGTALRGGLVNLSKPTKQMKQAMDKYNVSLKTNKDGSVDLKGTMENLRKSMKGLSETEKAAALGAIFGKTALSGWAAIVNATDEDFNKLASAIANSNGAAKEMQDTMMNNTEGSIKIMLSSIEGALLDVFKAIAPAVTEVAKSVTELANKFSGLDKNTQTFIVKGIAIAALVAPVMKVTGAVVTLGSKIAAIPVALKKMKRGEVERQVNAWLKWHNVTDQQAAKIRKVARDMDTVKRGGAGAENAAKRLDKALEKVNVPKDVVPDLNKVENAIVTSTNKAKNFNKTLGNMKVKGVKGIKVDGSSVDVDIHSIKDKVTKSGVGKSIGKTIVTDTASIMSSTLGSTVGSAVGSTMGPVGALIGDILGSSVGDGLAAAITSGSGFTGMLKSLPKLFNPVGLGIAGVTAAIGGLVYATRDVPAKFNLMSESVDESGKKIQAFSSTSEEANEVLKKFSDNWMTIDSSGNLKKFNIEVGLDYDQEIKAKTEAMEKDLQEHLNTRIEMIKNSNVLTEEQKNGLIEKEKERQEKLLGEVKSGLDKQVEAHKTFNTTIGMERYQAGIDMIKGDLDIAKQTELFYAKSLDERLEIDKKYSDKFQDAKGKYVEDNWGILKEGFNNEIKLIADSRELQLNQIKEWNKKEIEEIKKKYGEGTDEYRWAMENQEKAFQDKVDHIVFASDQELQASKDRMAQFVDEVNDLKKNGKISRETAQEIFEEWSKLKRAEFKAKFGVDLEDYEVGKEDFLKFVEEVDGKEISPKLNINNTPFTEEMIKAKIEAANMNQTKIEPTLDLRRSPFYSAKGKTEEEMKQLNESKIQPSVYLDNEVFNSKYQDIKDKLEGVDRTKVHGKVGMEKSEFDTKNTDVTNKLGIINNTTSIPKIGMNTATFDQGKNKVDAANRNIAAQTPTPSVRMDYSSFYNGKRSIDTSVSELNNTYSTVRSNLDSSGAKEGHWSLRNWIANNPIIQKVKTMFTGGDSSSKHRATGGQIGSGTTIVGRLLPTLKSAKSVSTAFC